MKLSLDCPRTELLNWITPPGDNRRMKGTILVFLVSVAAAGADGAVVSPTDEIPAYFPAGVANVAGSVGCVRTLAGGVDALDLGTGKRLWKSDPPSRALYVGSESAILLEQRNGRLQIAAYEPRKGRCIKAWPCNFALPPWASLAETSGGRTWTTFEVRAIRRSGVLEIGYDAQEHVVTGIAPPSTGPQATGIIRFELGSGRIEHHPGETLAPFPFVESAPARGLQPLRFHARPCGPTLMLGGPPPDVQGALIAGDSRIVFEKAPDGRGVIVRRWRASTGAAEPSVTIAAAVTDVIWPTLDRRHVALRRAHEQSKCDVYSLASGARIATLVKPVDIAVVGERILWTAYSGRDQMALIASETATGRTLWRRTVWHDTPPGEPIP